MLASKKPVARENTYLARNQLRRHRWAPSVSTRDKVRTSATVALSTSVSAVSTLFVQVSVPQASSRVGLTPGFPGKRVNQELQLHRANATKDPAVTRCFPDVFHTNITSPDQRLCGATGTCSWAECSSALSSRPVKGKMTIDETHTTTRERIKDHMWDAHNRPVLAAMRLSQRLFSCGDNSAPSDTTLSAWLRIVRATPQALELLQDDASEKCSVVA